jgi:hypothetical protein
MKLMRPQPSPGHNVVTALGGAAMLGLAYLVLRSVPELIRYVRIRKM